jgi:hypothetical protein
MLEKEQQKNPPNLDRQAKLTNDLAKYTNAMREIMTAVNWAACGCKLWDFEIGYHSQN